MTVEISTTATAARNQPVVHIDWRSALINIWAVLSLAALGGILISWMRGYRLIATSHPIPDENLSGVMQHAMTALHVQRRPQLRVSDKIRCPLIWCWGFHPTLLLPKSQLDHFTANQWEGVFLHELSHWKRGDYISSLLSKLLICALPWHPLTWLTKKRMSLFSERACDCWALSNGQHADAYAETLLSLFPQPVNAWALPMLTNRTILQRRIEDLFSIQNTNPKPGRIWLFTTFFATACAAMVLSLSQISTAKAETAEEKSDSKQTVRAMAKTWQIDMENMYTSLSPNERFMAGLKFNEGKSEFIIVDLQSGEQKKWDVSPWYYVWSPDEKRIAYNSRNSISFLSIDTGKIEEFYSGKNLWLEDWSSDGQYLLCREDGSNRDDKKNTIVLISISSKELKEFSTNEFGDSEEINPRFSPDSKNFVYNIRENDQFTLHFQSVDGSEHIIYQEFKGSIENPLWSPDGQYVIFKGSNGKNVDFWGLKVENGKPIEIPFIVKPNTEEMYLIAWTKRGKLLYSIENSCGIYIIPVDVETGNVKGMPRMIARGAHIRHLWSPDGKQIAQMVDTAGKLGFAFYSVKTGMYLHEFPISKMTYYGMGFGWLSDRNAILYGGKDTDGNAGFFAFDVLTGEPTFLVSNPKAQSGMFALSCARDNKTVACINDGHVVVGNIDDWNPVQISKVKDGEKPRFGFPIISPNGEWVAYSERTRRLLITSIDGGETRELLNFDRDGLQYQYYHWSPNGKFIAFSSDKKLWLIATEGGKPFQISLPKEAGLIYWPRWSPDGKFISFQGYGGSQYWVMENFLPKN